MIERAGEFNMPQPLDLRLDDVVQLRKAHPCGGDVWRIVRLGAEIGIRCERCGRRVLLPRSVLERRIKRFVARSSDASAPTPSYGSLSSLEGRL